ncbi:hypothetical protein PPL_09380 [Heterostelium album PN500]|uniref:Uncharacterized protein n=1 Tax=Heterostelium pallidum (strain ATCC 26659 / Pp 5 / PN500) TaxID=670386 RepID=D3BLE6_HETP5|nr:hypothetical protein PPL_09380 [Heterostelium album PN500]EFA77880.1 hypothetical protein PPL_09380 [Heterostelium album PN500]|eukprot:XP_020430008.1 hypothetical protein PPL_09380 [Heterostelium album PN500]
MKIYLLLHYDHLISTHVDQQPCFETHTANKRHRQTPTNSNPATTNYNIQSPSQSSTPSTLSSSSSLHSSNNYIVRAHPVTIIVNNSRTNLGTR